MRKHPERDEKVIEFRGEIPGNERFWINVPNDQCE